MYFLDVNFYGVFWSINFCWIIVVVENYFGNNGRNVCLGVVDVCIRV